MNKQLSEIFVKNPYPGENDGPDSIALSTLIDTLKAKTWDAEMGARIEFSLISNTRSVGYETTCFQSDGRFWYTWETSIYKVHAQDGRERFSYVKIGKGNMDGLDKPSVRQWYLKDFKSDEEVLGCCLFSELFPRRNHRPSDSNVVPLRRCNRR